MVLVQYLKKEFYLLSYFNKNKKLNIQKGSENFEQFDNFIFEMF
jgi:hypothetical protein